ncbi:Immunogenic protein MPT70 precursor [Maioricimonas rarisocia]|uniref:Immunogenic protein MPT70 n=1 Tax=Maioricimonas rarisocia TaxID=2528026 RepID=A0A517Z5Q4_9PLAN|nr:fasciclin domain-containing protein [Maioricimonas rarisocia]QDU37797.1 Immunogenic protein MPT70 precursor [Maioricimonas rarisocia]
MKRFALSAVALFALFALSNRPAQAAEKSDIVDTAVAAGSFNTLATALKSAGLVHALKGEGPFTVFAPTDEAFGKLPEGTVENLLKPENRDQLTAILTYHVVPGKVMAEQVVGLNGAISLNGQRVDIKVADDKVQVDGAQVVKTDIACSNGVIHVIDSVILPASDNIPTTAANASQFKTLLTAVKAAGLAEVLSGEGPFTVFAPTDDAFARLPEGTVESLLEPQNRDQLTAILKYHVVSGRVYSEQALEAGKAKTLQGRPIRIRVVDGKAKVNKAGIVATDVDASNGVIHVIDTVLLPPKGKKSAEVAPPAAAPVAAAPVHASKSRTSSCSGNAARPYQSTASRRVVRYHYSR